MLNFGSHVSQTYEYAIQKSSITRRIRQKKIKKKGKEGIEREREREHTTDRKNINGTIALEMGSIVTE